MDVRFTLGIYTQINLVQSNKPPGVYKAYRRKMYTFQHNYSVHRVNILGHIDYQNLHISLTWTDLSDPSDCEYFLYIIIYFTSLTRSETDAQKS